jgi:hypothetical protein
LPQWEFPRKHASPEAFSGTIKNVATKRCAATGKEKYQGRYIQAWFCDDADQYWDFVPVESA